MPSKSKRKNQVGSGDPVTDIHQRLQALGYITSDRALMAECYALQMKALMTTKAVPAMLLQGPPGTGKTFLAETMRKEWDATTFLFYQFAPGVTKEDLVFDLNIANIAMAQAGKWEGDFKAEDTIAPGKLVQALQASQKGRTVLLLDELDKASEKVDAFLLDYLQSCRLDAGQLGVVYGNPKNLMVFITMNNQRQISEPLMRRCLRHELEWPVPDVEKQMILTLAERQLAQLGRMPYPDLKIQLQAHAPLMVQFANEIRSYSQQLKKVPSSPELADALVDVACLPNTSDWGPKVYATLLAYPEDRKLAKGIWKKTPQELGRQLAEAVARSRNDRDRLRAMRKQGITPPSNGSVFTKTPVVIEPGKYYYTVTGDEPLGFVKSLVKDGVLVKNMPRPVAASIQTWARETGLPYMEWCTELGIRWDGFRTDLSLDYSDLVRLTQPLPAECIVVAA